MHEGLQSHPGNLSMNGRYLVERQLSCQDCLAETLLSEPPHLLCRAIIHLGGGMQFYGQSHFQESQILHDEGINPHPCQLKGKLVCILQLIIKENGIERHIDTHTKWMGKVYKFPNVFDTVAGRCTCTITESSDVDSIGPVQDSFHAGLQVAGG